MCGKSTEKPVGESWDLIHILKRTLAATWMEAQKGVWVAGRTVMKAPEQPPMCLSSGLLDWTWQPGTSLSESFEWYFPKPLFILHTGPNPHISYFIVIISKVLGFLLPLNVLALDLKCCKINEIIHNYILFCCWCDENNTCFYIRTKNEIKKCYLKFVCCFPVGGHLGCFRYYK